MCKHKHPTWQGVKVRWLSFIFLTLPCKIIFILHWQLFYFTIRCVYDSVQVFFLLPDRYCHPGLVKHYHQLYNIKGNQIISYLDKCLPRHMYPRQTAPGHVHQRLHPVQYGIYKSHKLNCDCDNGDNEYIKIYSFIFLWWWVWYSISVEMNMIQSCNIYLSWWEWYNILTVMSMIQFIGIYKCNAGS